MITFHIVPAGTAEPSKAAVQEGPSGTWGSAAFLSVLFSHTSVYDLFARRPFLFLKHFEALALLQRIKPPYVGLSAQHSSKLVLCLLDCGPKALISAVAPSPPLQSWFSPTHRCWAFFALGLDPPFLLACSFSHPHLGPRNPPLLYSPHSACCGAQFSGEKTSPEHLPPGRGWWVGRVLGSQRPLLTGTRSHPHCCHGQAQDCWCLSSLGHAPRIVQ